MRPSGGACIANALAPTVPCQSPHGTSHAWSARNSAAASVFSCTPSASRIARAAATARTTLGRSCMLGGRPPSAAAARMLLVEVVLNDRPVGTDPGDQHLPRDVFGCVECCEGLRWSDFTA